MTTLHPMRDYLLVKREKAAEPTSASGIITDTVKETCRTRGKVIAAGPGTFREGAFHKTSVEPGTDIVFRDSFTIQVEKVDGEEFLLMPETEVIAVVGACE